MLTDHDIKRLNYRHDPYSFAPQQWRDLVALLPSSAEPEVLRLVLDLFVLAAIFYWEGMNESSKAKKEVPKLARLIKVLHSAKEDIIELRPHGDKQISQTDALIEAFEKDLSSQRPLASYSKGAGANRRSFVWRAVQLWMLLTNGDNGISQTKSGHASGPLIRYLVFACDLVMGEKKAKPNTLAVDVKRFRDEFAGRKSRIVYF